MTVTVRYWAGARRAAGRAEESFAATDLASLREQLAARPALGRILAVAAILVDGEQADPTTVLADGAVVDVLPPFAGGRQGQ